MLNTEWPQKRKIDRHISKRHRKKEKRETDIDAKRKETDRHRYKERAGDRQTDKAFRVTKIRHLSVPLPPDLFVYICSLPLHLQGHLH